MNNGDGIKMDDRWRKTRQTLDELRAESQAKARRAVRITNNYAHDHPWRMATTAGALALVAGLLIRGGSSKKPEAVLKKRFSEAESRLKNAASNAKVKSTSSGTGPGWEAVHALVPLILLGVKAWQSSRSHRNTPAPATATAEPAGAPAPAA